MKTGVQFIMSSCVFDMAEFQTLVWILVRVCRGLPPLGTELWTRRWLLAACGVGVESESTGLAHTDALEAAAPCSASPVTHPQEVRPRSPWEPRCTRGAETKACLKALMIPQICRQRPLSWLEDLARVCWGRWDGNPPVLSSEGETSSLLCFLSHSRFQEMNANPF